MHLTRFSDLGLRIVMRLGESGNGSVDKRARRETVAAIAESINASRDHVARVVAKLTALEVVRSERGRAGGVYLNDTAPERSVGWLLRELEGSGEVINCIEPECPYAARDCLLRHRLAAAKEAFFASLDDFTVGELISATVNTAPPGAVGLGLPTIDSTCP